MLEISSSTVSLGFIWLCELISGSCNTAVPDIPGVRYSVLAMPLRNYFRKAFDLHEVFWSVMPSLTVCGWKVRSADCCAAASILHAMPAWLSWTVSEHEARWSTARCRRFLPISVFLSSNEQVYRKIHFCLAVLKVQTNILWHPGARGIFFPLTLLFNLGGCGVWNYIAIPFPDSPRQHVKV